MAQSLGRVFWDSGFRGSRVATEKGWKGWKLFLQSGGDQIHNNKMYKTQKTKTRACFFFFLQHRRGGGWRSVGGVLERTKKKKKQRNQL